MRQPLAEGQVQSKLNLSIYSLSDSRPTLMAFGGVWHKTTISMGLLSENTIQSFRT